MSATAFQRLRREQETKRLAELESPEDHVTTVAELKALLDEKGIEYNARARKEDLNKLLEGAE
ncbi:MAG: HeH/LEM domain-containing protein [Ruminiclostridium sp.]